ncbi:MAG: hypothetical protein ACI4JB_11800 [Porcipelethomonas sp.]
MKKDFFELMKNYDPERNAEINLSPDRIKEKSLKKINAKPQRRKIHFTKKFAVIAAAAAVFLTAGFTVLAYEFGVFDKAVSFFENKNAADTVNLNETDRNIINENLKENSIIVESNETTIQLTGSMYDENMAYFFFKLTAPEGTVLDSETYDFKENTIVYDKKHYGGAGWCLVFDDDDLTDNITYFTLKMNCNGFSVQDCYEINLSNLYVYSYFQSDNPADDKIILRGQWTIPLETGEPVEAIELCKEPSTVKLGNKSADISGMMLSPLSLTLTSSNELYLGNTNIGAMDKIIISNNYKDAMLYGVEIFIKMKNGSIYTDINMGGGGNAEGNGLYTDIYYFDKPIDIDNVESVVIGDCEFKVE